MKEVSIIGVDLAKQVFQLHGAAAEDDVVFSKKLSRKQFLAFMQSHPECCVAMAACATAHFWARTLTGLGSRGASHRAQIRQAICEDPEERHGGC